MEALADAGGILALIFIVGAVALGIVLFFDSFNI